MEYIIFFSNGSNGYKMNGTKLVEISDFFNKIDEIPYASSLGYFKMEDGKMSTVVALSTFGKVQFQDTFIRFAGSKNYEKILTRRFNIKSAIANFFKLKENYLPILRKIKLKMVKENVANKKQNADDE